MTGRLRAWRAAGLAILLLLAAPCGAAEPVDLALVLLADVSGSIDGDDFALQKQGYTAALSDPRVIAAIRGGGSGRIALCYLEFATVAVTVVDWTIIHDAATAAAFAEQVRAAPRSFAGNTSISAGVALAMRLLANPALAPRRRVIDVSGDGTNNDGRDIVELRNEAVAAGITINGIAIINERPRPWSSGGPFIADGLDGYYRRAVAGGPGAFVIRADDFTSFGEAMTRKLITEIAGLAVPPQRLAGP